MTKDKIRYTCTIGIQYYMPMTCTKRWQNLVKNVAHVLIHKSIVWDADAYQIAIHSIAFFKNYRWCALFGNISLILIIFTVGEYMNKPIRYIFLKISPGMCFLPYSCTDNLDQPILSAICSDLWRRDRMKCIVSIL